MRKMLLFDEIQFFLSVIRSAVALLYLFLFFSVDGSAAFLSRSKQWESNE